MNLNNKHKGLVFTMFLVMLLLQGCAVKVDYSFGGVTIDPAVKTISILYFQNRARQVQPTLSQDITDALIDKCKAQTNLKLVSSGGDVSFEGYITDYNSLPFTATSNSTSTEQSSMNRFTISVKVKYINAVEPDLSYDQTFSRYQDYSSNLDWTSVEAELSEEIVKLLIEDIFNKAFVNW